jgi:TetR/AcrR family transcriptional regulator, transcriptional repressor for nem operon
VTGVATARAAGKQRSLHKILDAASIRLREQGLDGAAIAPIMQAAGLTHGAFYAHFANKDALAQAAFDHALRSTQPRWFGERRESWRARLGRLARTYLTPRHRDDVGHGCAIGALVGDAAQSSEAFRKTYQQALVNTLHTIADNDDATRSDRQKFDDAIALLALCVGGISLARAVTDPVLSKRILDVCSRRAAAID